MARGRGRGHKGQRRHFTNPDDLNAQKDKKDKEKEWRQRRGDSDDSDDDSDNEDKSSESDSESEDEDLKAKGVASLIEVENPNRIVKKAVKTANLDTASSSKDETQLSRREREELEKQRARENYARLHSQGKTDEARADLARLAIIKQQREEAQKKRDEEKKARDEELKSKQSNRALGKK